MPFEALGLREKGQLQPSSSLTALAGNVGLSGSSVNNIPRPRPIQKSTTELNVDPALCDEEDEESPEASSSFPLSLMPLRPSSLSASRRGCGFCLSNGERQRECMSHRLKNPDTLIVECPQLRKFVCPLCQATGDYAHTQGYCPLNDADIPTVKHLKKKRSSAGRLAGGKNLRADMPGVGVGAFAGAAVSGANGPLGVVDSSIIAIGPKGGQRG